MPFPITDARLTCAEVEVDAEFFGAVDAEPIVEIDQLVEYVSLEELYALT